MTRLGKPRQRALDHGVIGGQRDAEITGQFDHFTGQHENIMLGEEDESKRKALLEHIMQQFPVITTLLYTINTKWNDSLHDLEPVVYHGKGYVIEKLEDFQFKIGPKSFFQTNTKQGELLYKVTRDFAELTGNETVYDLYCGTGSIGIFVSKKGKEDHRCGNGSRRY